MSVVKLASKTRDLTSALSVLDGLRKRLESGQIIAFGMVEIDAEDNAYTSAATTEPVSRLRMIGAIHHLLHCYETGDA